MESSIELIIIIIVRMQFAHGIFFSRMNRLDLIRFRDFTPGLLSREVSYGTWKLK